MINETLLLTAQHAGESAVHPSSLQFWKDMVRYFLHQGNKTKPPTQRASAPVVATAATKRAAMKVVKRIMNQILFMVWVKYAWVSRAWMSAANIGLLYYTIGRFWSLALLFHLLQRLATCICIWQCYFHPIFSNFNQCLDEGYASASGETLTPVLVYPPTTYIGNELGLARSKYLCLVIRSHATSTNR